MGHLGVLLVELTQFRILLQGTLYGNVQFIWHHLSDGIHKGIRKVHHPSHIPDHTFGRQGTEGDDLHHFVRTVFPPHIVNDLLSAVEAEVYVNIGHGHALRIQKTLKEQIITNGINIGDLQAVGDDASRCGTTARPHRYPVFPGIIDEVPHDQEIVHIPHPPDHAQFVVQPLPKGLASVPGRGTGIAVALLHPLVTEPVQVTPGIIPFRHLIVRQFRDPELDLHLAAVRDPLGVLHRLPGIGEQALHLLLALHIILAALIAHPVLIGELLARLQAQKDIVGVRILCIGVVDIIGGHQGNVQFPAHLQQFRVHHALFRKPVVL